MTVVAAVITKIYQYILASKSSSYQERYAIVSAVLLFISTVIPVYWTWANDDLSRFTKRLIMKMLMRENIYCCCLTTNKYVFRKEKKNRPKGFDSLGCK